MFFKWMGRFLVGALSISVFITLWAYFNSTCPSHQARNNAPFGPMPQFVEEAPNFDLIGEGLFGDRHQRLKKSLKSQFVYRGVNNRPDQTVPILFFQFENQDVKFESKKMYPLSEVLLKDVSPSYAFCVTPKNGGARFEVFEGVDRVFTVWLPENKVQNTDYIDQHKLDNFILVRQKVSWQGQDEFLNDFGAKEYPDAQQAERLDFIREGGLYSIYAAPTRCFVYKRGQWQKPGEDSKNYPLLQVKCVQGSQMQLSIWDVSGLHEEKITLAKSTSAPIPATLFPLKFIGAKSQHKWLLKVNKERLAVEKGDWLLHLGHKWEKVQSVQAIDAYVQSLHKGELFVVEEFQEKGNLKFLKGKLYGASRTSQKEFQIPLSPLAKKQTP